MRWLVIRAVDRILKITTSENLFLNSQAVWGGLAGGTATSRAKKQAQKRAWIIESGYTKFLQAISPFHSRQPGFSAKASKNYVKGK
jgi:hypothetical protein